MLGYIASPSGCQAVLEQLTQKKCETFQCYLFKPSNILFADNCFQLKVFDVMSSVYWFVYILLD
jgi:hypothetical protein